LIIILFVNRYPTKEIGINRLVISNKEFTTPSTPQTKIEQPKNHDQFDQGNIHKYFNHRHRNRIITLENLRMNLPDDDQFNQGDIHKYFNHQNQIKKNLVQILH
jgi:hypothetical protein